MEGDMLILFVSPFMVVIFEVPNIRGSAMNDESLVDALAKN